MEMNFAQYRLKTRKIWVHHYDPEIKWKSVVHQSVQQFTAIKKINSSSLRKKSDMTTFWDSNSIVFIDILKKGTKAEEQNQKGSQPQNTTSKPHIGVQMQEATEDLPLTVLLHPQYSPNLVPGNFHLLCKFILDMYT